MATEAAMEQEEEKELNIKWNGDTFTLNMAADDTVGDLKRRLGEMTRVLPKRQKLMGLKDANNKPAQDGCSMASLKMKPGQAVMMIGAPEEVIARTNEAGAAGGDEVVDDFQIDAEIFEQLEPHKDPDVLAKLERRIKMVDVTVLNEPRAGKKLLVVDIDYTIFDLGSSAENPSELARPHLHAFFTSAYQHFDIVIWSANSLKWMNVKMRALGVLAHADYKVTFMIDYRSMLTVQTQKRGVFDCKPLAFIWRKFPDAYNEGNTVMLDDLRRNYIMNKQNGLVIRPFQKAHQNRDTDRELVRLKYYFMCIGQLDTLSELQHGKWEKYMSQRLSSEQMASLQADIANP